MRIVLAHAFPHDLHQIQRDKDVTTQSVGHPLPEPLIHSTSSSFAEQLPVLACVSNGSLPMRAVRDC
jgi:hypothetical protein